MSELPVYKVFRQHPKERRSLGIEESSKKLKGVDMS